jgi:hypothetical protein
VGTDSGCDWLGLTGNDWSLITWNQRECSLFQEVETMANDICERKEPKLLMYQLMEAGGRIVGGIVTVGQ